MGAVAGSIVVLVVGDEGCADDLIIRAPRRFTDVDEGVRELEVASWQAADALRRYARGRERETGTSTSA